MSRYIFKYDGKYYEFIDHIEKETNYSKDFIGNCSFCDFKLKGLKYCSEIFMDSSIEKQCIVGYTPGGNNFVGYYKEVFLIKEMLEEVLQ